MEKHGAVFALMRSIVISDEARLKAIQALDGILGSAFVFAAHVVHKI